jgi:hypothetical protein
MKTSEVTAEMLRERMAYDPETGVFRLRRSQKRWKAGQVAGSLGKNGYVHIRVAGVLCLAHRLAWLYVNGVWPAEQVDHINGDRIDNRMANLRLATNQQNQRNSKLPRDNTSGFKGAFLVSSRKHWKKGRRWKAAITVNSRSIHLGYFATPEEAHAAYCAAAEKHYGEFARAS